MLTIQNSHKHLKKAVDKAFQHAYMTINSCHIIMVKHLISFRVFLTGYLVSNYPKYRFSQSAFRKQLTGHSGQTGGDFVFIFSLKHLPMTPIKTGKKNINLTSVTFHQYLAPQMLPSFSRRLMEKGEIAVLAT